MKKIVLALALMIAALSASAGNGILYFTYSQASRAVATLNSQDEIMIYCGYEDELPTYCLVNEVWAEQVTASFYELWIYGYDAYTGEEIYMPFDLECIYLLRGNAIVSAAQYMRFRYTHSRPTFAWDLPPYHPFTRHPHPPTFSYYYTYHYDIHRPGWHYHLHPEMHYHPYYCRRPHTPHPHPAPFHPGREIPTCNPVINPVHGQASYTYGVATRITDGYTTTRSYTPVQNNPTNRAGNRITSDRSAGTIVTTDRATGRASSEPAPSRVGTATNTRSTSTATETPSRSSSAATRSTSTAAETPSRSTSTGTRSSSSSSTATETPSRSTSTGTRANSSSSTATPSSSTSRSTSTGTRANSTSTQSNTNTRGTSRGTRPDATSTQSDNNSRGTSRGTRPADNSSSNTTATQSSSSSRGTSRGTRPADNSSNTSSRGTSTGTRR